MATEMMMMMKLSSKRFGAADCFRPSVWITHSLTGYRWPAAERPVAGRPVAERV